MKEKTYNYDSKGNLIGIGIVEKPDKMAVHKLGKTLDCLECKQVKHVNDFATPDTCNDCFEKSEQ